MPGLIDHDRNEAYACPGIPLRFPWIESPKAQTKNMSEICSWWWKKVIYHGRIHKQSPPTKGFPIYRGPIPPWSHITGKGPQQKNMFACFSFFSSFLQLFPLPLPISPWTKTGCFATAPTWFWYILGFLGEKKRGLVGGKQLKVSGRVGVYMYIQIHSCIFQKKKIYIYTYNIYIYGHPPPWSTHKHFIW